jgi:hypothetical protein
MARWIRATAELVAARLVTAQLVMGGLALGLTGAGCASESGAKPFIAWPESWSKPASSTAAATSAPATSNAGVVPQKPFIAGPRLLAGDLAPPGHPTLLLELHARADSPVPISQYARQPTHDVCDFRLRPALSAEELRRRLGPPAQLADYSTPWLVYRLGSGKELWLHFAQPENDTLVAADVVGPVEDGYTRNRVFSIHDAQQ